MNVLLDTHVLLWWKATGDRLSVRARREIARADAILLSPLTFWEVGMLASRGRAALDRDLLEWVSDLIAEPGIELAPLSARAAGVAAQLADPFPGDPADRMIYATARELLVPLISKDARVRTYAAEHRDVRVIW